MCDLCRNADSRNYTHSRNKYHFKFLKKRMLLKKKLSVEKYGYFKYDPNIYVTL